MVSSLYSQQEQRGGNNCIIFEIEKLYSIITILVFRVRPCLNMFTMYGAWCRRFSFITDFRASNLLAWILTQLGFRLYRHGWRMLTVLEYRRGCGMNKKHPLFTQQSAQIALLSYGWWELRSYWIFYSQILWARN